MDLLTLLCLFTLFHTMIYFIDQFLKSCVNVPYFLFLENLGITVQPFQLHVYTSFFNRLITKWYIAYKKFCNIWFTIGAIAVILLLIPSILLLIYSFIAQFKQKEYNQSQQVLQPVVPGYNLPIHEFPFYFWTLLISSVFHEFGHALAAVKEDVHINGFGFMLVYILPAAYVDLPTEGVRNLSPFRQLRIFCAGVWHNVVLCIGALFFGLAIPFILKPLYMHNKGVMVLNLQKSSPLEGSMGLKFGDVLTSVNDCPVASIASLRKCLLDLASKDQVGFCISEDVVNAHDETIDHPFARKDDSIECCSDGKKSHLCFELKRNEDEDAGEAAMHPYSCLPGRVAIAASLSSCETSSDCQKGFHCLAPSFRNSSRLLHIHRHNIKSLEQLKHTVIYMGYPSDLLFTVVYTNYIPKYSFLSNYFPNNLEILADYFVKFSGALAVLNLVPCFYLDGYRIVGSLIDLIVGSKVNILKRKAIHYFITVFGSLLLFLTISSGIYSIL